MPTFWQGENLVHFAVFKKHIGFYPGGEAIGAFAQRLAQMLEELRAGDVYMGMAYKNKRNKLS